MSGLTLVATKSAEFLIERPALEVKERGLLTIGVMLAMVMMILDSTVANVALPHMQASLGATFDTVTWVLTSYIIAAAVATPMTGWLSDVVGSRRLFLLSVGSFILASMACGAATSLTEIVIYRFIQGASGAFIGPLSQTAMLDINEPSRQSRAMAIWGMGIMVGPILGPIVGGWLTESYNWRWVFYINLPIGLVAFALIWWLLPSRPLSRRSFDLFGFSILALALSALQLMLDRGTDQDWFHSTEICIEALIVVSGTWIFLVHSFTAKNTLFDRKVVTNPNMATSLVFMVIIGLMMMAIMALMPPMLQRIYGYNVLDTGLLLAPRGVGIVASMFIASQLASRIDPRYLIMTGLTIAAASMWQMTQWSLVMDWHPIVISGIVQGFGMGLCFVPANALAFSTLDAKYRTEGSSLINLFRSLGGSVGISIITAVLGANFQTSHEDLASHITATSMSSVDPGTADRFGVAGQAAMAMVNAEVNRQALMIAYLDDFKLIMIILICALPVVLLLKPPRPGTRQQAGNTTDAMGH